MKAVIPVIIAVLLIILAIMAYMVSPFHEMSSLRAENTALRESLAQVRADNQVDLVAVVVVGMIILAVVMMAGFFMVICLLSGKRPWELIILPGRRYPPEIICRPEPERIAQEYYTDYRNDDRYAMEVMP